MNIQDILNKAPALPEFQAQYQAFQLEAIQGSGERFTVLLAAKSQAEFKIIQAVSPKVLQCMFLDYAKNIQGFISLLHDSLERYLAQGHALESWPPR